MRKRTKLQKLQDDRLALSDKISKSVKSTEELRKECTKLDKEIKNAQIEELQDYLHCTGLTVEDVRSRLDFINRYMLERDCTLEEVLAKLNSLQD